MAKGSKDWVYAKSKDTERMECLKEGENPTQKINNTRVWLLYAKALNNESSTGTNLKYLFPSHQRQEYFHWKLERRFT